ncbi:predicted protein [Sclerotinia sclerotiorum 1980 UF-70]|uniref:Uncharacterized protein n=2 Tax=Sclerotinia sclerotiorum (strain ATCC 18683 / 1980 / Ss-1) TaxID=665079 RepID=A7EFE5_SCLS1|nr:predicted protein [Sclerotinia sclerotiorum 1980 UF-70]APA07231.1 hypothetical protein sscle_02g020010 [Sclerotinia sclerotiorum 1980 UF-70]EDO01561.1 predicted protein [Sclerotinia sclerotiorum 1980 UF-70]
MFCGVTAIFSVPTSQNETYVSKGIGLPETLSWIGESGIKESTEIGKPENTAQVHPEYLTSHLLSLA